MDSDPHREMIDILESKNHDYFVSLLALDKQYDLVVHGKRYNNHDIPPTVSSDGSYKTNLTIPSTHANQDLLQKYGTASFITLMISVGC